MTIANVPPQNLESVAVEAPWAATAEEVAGRLKTNLEAGLSLSEVGQRLERYGPNRIETHRRRTPLKVLLAQFADLMIGLLAGAAVISALVGDATDAILIAFIVLANVGIGFAQEWRAEQAVEALRRLSQPHARVRRNGQMSEFDAEGLVPGDVVEIVAGDLIPADARLASAVELEVVESTLTGESLPVEKSARPDSADTALPDRRSMVYAGTAVVRGRCRALITATGRATELGRIASLLESAEEGPTPLQQRLSQLSRRLALVVAVICVVIFAAGVLREKPENWNRQLLSTMLLTAVSLAVAAIPEGLPAVITVALALGSQRMAKRKAIVRRLSAVESLGSVDVICTDKTGTLTQNRMSAKDIVPASDDAESQRALYEGAVLCNDAELAGEANSVGSPTERALLTVAVENGIDVGRLRAEWPRLAEVPFSSDRKRMTTLHRTPNGGRILFVKGAAERILSRLASDDGELQAWQSRLEDLARGGRRVIAVAARDWDTDTLPAEPETAETDLRLMGLFGIVDPVRPEAAAAIAECRSAGVRAVMITGDHPETARAIADEIGLRQSSEAVMTGQEIEKLSDEELVERVPTVTVYARVSPEHKLRIVTAWQTRGSITAMTGDGVNDAPALRKADIGVAMGVTGSDVAKEAGEMILADDNFATIVGAVEEGRIVYDNIRKFVAYLLTTNTGEVLVLFAAIMLGMPLPLLPIHVLWINLVTDGLPALALGFEPAEPGIMRRPPRRRDESLFADGLGHGIIWLGILMAVACLLLFRWYLPGDSDSHPDSTLAYARTMTFVALALFQLFHVMAIRSSEPFYRVGLWSNYRLTIAVALGVILQFAVVYVPQLQRYFHTVPLTAADAAIAVAVSSLIFVVIELWKQFQIRRNASL